MHQIPSFEINQMLIGAEHSVGTCDPSQPLVKADAARSGGIALTDSYIFNN